MKILYGVQNNTYNITEFCNNKLLKNNIIKIPPDDNVRAQIFGDPQFGTVKYIYIIYNGIEYIYDDSNTIIIDVINNSFGVDESEEKLCEIHNKLILEHGSFKDELPEQKMTMNYITGNEKILEIGGNIGRNSLIIAHILSKSNNNNFVTLECDNDICKILEHNRNINGFKFHIEGTALSKRKLIQKGWNTIESDILLEGYKVVKTITLEELNKKYNIDFDTLILDCEGAFYNILLDMPEILKNITMIIVENDYKNYEDKQYVDNILKKNNFNIVYSEELIGYEHIFSNINIRKNFYEVWKKI